MMLCPSLLALVLLVLTLSTAQGFAVHPQRPRIVGARWGQTQVAQAVEATPGPSGAEEANISTQEGTTVPSSRRRWLARTTSAALAVVASGGVKDGKGARGVEAASAAGGSSLADRIRDRNFAKPLFSLPPGEAVYPEWMEGEWAVKAGFGGYIFPSAKVSKDAVVKNQYTPGFKQLSIMSLADIGPLSADYKQRFVRRGGKVFEDKVYNLEAAMAGWLGEFSPLVDQAEYEPQQNANRLSFAFRPGRRNKNNLKRIEIFGNAREWQELGGAPAPAPGAAVAAAAVAGDGGGSSSPSTFIVSEYFRQVSFYQADSNTVSRELVCDVQQFMVYNRSGPSKVKCSLLTAGYLQPQDANYFESPTQPVVLYSHTLDMERLGDAA